MIGLSGLFLAYICHKRSKIKLDLCWCLTVDGCCLFFSTVTVLQLIEREVLSHQLIKISEAGKKLINHRYVRNPRKSKLSENVFHSVGMLCRPVKLSGHEQTFPRKRSRCAQPHGLGRVNKYAAAKEVK